MEPRVIAGRYAVIRAVGRGGTGTVWLCRDEVLGREVAVKEVGHLPGETTSDVHRALREARSSAALNHPHVVSIYDAVEDGDRNWLVMEYVPSRTLAELLAEEGPMSPERAARIGAQAADGLAAAHARGTMHRDVKPGNILVGADDHVKITDFGIARTDGDMQLTQTGFITGTPAYFAPETARGLSPGLPADVWALGATLYAAVEGTPPYPEQTNALAMLTTIATKSSPLPRRAGVLTEAVNRMMDRDPATRWTMAEAARALHDVVAGEAAGHGSDSAPQPTVALPVGAAAVPAAAETAGTAGTTGTERPERTGGRPRWVLAWVAVLLLAAVAFGVALVVGQDEDEPASGPTSSAEPGSSSPSSPAGGASSPAPEETEQNEQTEEPPPEQTEEPPSEQTEEPTEEPTEQPVAGDVEAFGRDYYTLLPEDTSAAYSLLSRSYGITLEDYDAFWSTIDAVEVSDATQVDETTVDVTLTYTTDGGTESETRRLYLEPADGGFEIVADEIV